jgi:hypothetical protein
MSKNSQRNRAAFYYGYQVGLGKARYDSRRWRTGQWSVFESGRDAGIAERARRKRSLWRRFVLMIKRVFR